MAYPTYITEALVCGTFDSKTSDRSYLLFTREAGMIYASAKSVREERSKQRYALQLCSHIRATLVRGKNGWRVIGVEPIQNLYAIQRTREARTFLKRMLLLLRRVIHGETTHHDIFDDVVSACTQGEYPYTKLEPVVSLRMLHTLGYIAPESSYERFLAGPLSYEEIAGISDHEEKACKEAIEHALMQSQL